MKFFCLILSLLSILPTRAFASNEDCSLGVNAAAQLPPGARILSQKMTNFGNAIPATFNPKRTGALTQKVDQIFSNDGLKTPVYLNEQEKAYGIKSVKFLSEWKDPNDTTPGRGVSLLGKYASVVKNSGGSESLLAYATATKEQDPQGLLAMNDMSPDETMNKAQGNCQIWSAWSMDPEVRKIFSMVKEGIFCNGYPFSKGELAELMNAVYPDPTKNLKTDKLKSVGYYDPKKNPANPTYDTGTGIEDANLALAMLGEFGKPPVASGQMAAPETYSDNPSKFIEMAQAAKAQGKTMMMDLDPGSIDIWNQPIECVIDVSYQDPSSVGERAEDFLTSQSLAASPNVSGAEGAALLQKLAVAEAQLKYQALRGDRNVAPEIAAILQANHQPSSYRMPIVAQVQALKDYKLALIRSQKLVPTEASVVRHKLIMQYGSESKFAERIDSSKNSKSRTLDYVTVNGHSSWRPPSRKLSEVCSDANTQNRVINQAADRIDRDGNRTQGDPYGLVDYGDDAHMSATCDQLIAGKIPDREFVTGAFPPKNLQVYTSFEKNQDGSTTDVRFGAQDAKKREAYDFLKNMILKCDETHGANFHAASVFVDRFQKKCMTNQLSEQDVTDLAADYKRLNSVLDAPAELQDGINRVISDHGGNPANVVNLSTFIQRISQ